MMEILSAGPSPIQLRTTDEAEYAIIGQERRDRGNVEESPERCSVESHYLGWTTTIATSESSMNGCCVKLCCFYSFFGVVYLSTVTILLRKKFFYSKIEGAELPYSTAKLAGPVESTAVMFFVVLVIMLATLCYRWKRSGCWRACTYILCVYFKVTCIMMTIQSATVRRTAQYTLLDNFLLYIVSALLLLQYHQFSLISRKI